MKKYAVCLYSNFDGSMNMDIVFAKSQVEAGKKFLASEGDNTLKDMQHIRTYDDLQQYVFDQDHAIGVLAVVTECEDCPPEQSWQVNYQ
jgi:hypothetical protein